MRELEDTIQYGFPSGFRLAPLRVIYPHSSLLCGPVGDDNRIKVQPGDYAFDKGRVWRSFHRFSVPTATSAYLRVVVDVPLYLRALNLNLISSEILLSTIAEGTVGTPFNTAVPSIPMNNIPGITLVGPGAVITAGGTATGGTVIDQLWGKAGNNANFSSSVMASDEHVRGIAPGTYFYRLENTDGDLAEGVFSAEWEVADG